MKRISPSRKWLEKKSKRGVHAYPVGTIAYYGPDNRRATKVAVGIIPFPDAAVAEMRRWTVAEGDIRGDERILGEIIAYLKANGAHSVAMTSGILGCPHEEGIDYPEDEPCPECPFWAGRDRWAEGMG